MNFPFPSVRDSQREMIQDVKGAIENRMHLIADAPTRIGKTIAVLYPAVEYALENKKIIFFLTSRLSQHKAAVETLQAMKSVGSKFRAVDIVGKQNLCSHEVSGMDSSMFNSFCSAMIKDGQCKYYKNFKREIGRAHV